MTDPYQAGAPSGPLEGVRVVDLTSVMFGPFATYLLGEMGATVFKIEPPGGDINRYTGATRSPGMSTGHLLKSRNKRSIVLDLKQPEGIEALRRLTGSADVFVHNMRPQAAEKLGIDYDAVREWKADVVYAEAVGFGETGPYAQRPAYDDLIQGMCGIAGLYQQATGQASYAPTVMADKTSGLYLVAGISMALFHRQRTGEGQKVHVPMFECMSSFMMAEHLQGQTFDPPTGPAGYQRLLTPHRKPHETSDGYVCLMPYNDRHWGSFLRLIERPDLIDDSRFNTQSARSENIDALYAIVAENMKKRSTTEWLELLSAADVPCGPMYSPEDLLTDPHLEAVGMFPLTEHPTEGRIRHIGAAVTFSQTPGGLYRHAEPLGRSSQAVLSELGYSDEALDALVDAGVTVKVLD